MSHETLTRKLFLKLLGLLAVLLVLYILLMEAVFSRLAGAAPHWLGREGFWLVLIALCVALPAAAWAASRAGLRLRRITDFSRRIADGDLSARMEVSGGDELAATGTALNQAAGQLEHGFAEIESRRQELAAILDTMQEAVVVVTPEGMVRWSNASLQRIAGTQIYVGRSLVQSVRDPELLSCVRGALERQQVCTGRASTLASGRIFEINAAPLPGGGALAVLHDVTRLEAAERARRDFIANVSHELRTPLTSIQGFIETLIEDPSPDPETNNEFLGIVLKNATRMNRLVQDLLTLTSLDSPDNKMLRRPMLASVLFQDAVNALGGMVADSGMELELAGAPEALVLANSDAMNQVFANLIENAIKYAREGRRIRAGAQLLPAEVEFFVRDFGPGIASEHLERIFERFYRVDKARSREAGGTGLGLAIVKHIILAHNGRIWVESELGAGAAFRFTLPLAPEEASGTSEQSEPADGPSLNRA